MTATAPHCTPRLKLRLRARPELLASAQQRQGRTCWIFKDPIRLRYYQFNEREFFLIGLLDGRRTIAQVRQEYERQFRPSRLSPEELEAFIHQLVTSGLVSPDAPANGDRLVRQGRQQRRQERLSSLTNLLSIRIPLWDPNVFLGWLAPRLRWLFSGLFFLAAASGMLLALLSVVLHFQTFRDRLPEFQQFFSFGNAVMLWLLLAAVKVVHEFGHGLACKTYGGDVNEMGVMLLCFAPCLYCEVSDAWMLPSRWQRIAIGFAGMYFELLIASLATLAWWHSDPGTLFNHLCLSLMVVCSVTTVAFNANPLLRFDGYHMLADFLEIPNFGDRCRRQLRHLMLRLALGVTPPVEQPLSRSRRWLFTTYAVASWLYRWLVVLGTFWFLHSLLKPYQMEAVAGLLAGLVLVSMAAWPTFGLIQALCKGRRLPEMNPRRVVLSGSLAAACLIGFFLMPLPIASLRQTALVQVQPDAADHVYVASSGLLTRLHVRNGQRVAAGDLLAEFRSPELETILAEKSAAHDIQTMRLAALRELASVVVDPAEQDRLAAQLAAAGHERQLLAREIAIHEAQVDRLQLRAPRAGIVLGLPTLDQVGKLWDLRDPDPFCTIAEPGKLQALVPLAPADYHRLREELADRPGQPLPATVRLAGQGLHTCPAQVGRLAESEAREVPAALSTQAGGPLPTHPGATPRTCIPQSQHYLAIVDITPPDDSLFPGTLVQVKVHCRWRTAAWWVWQTLAGTFRVL